MAEGYTEAEVTRLAVEHFVETGHTVESLRLPPPDSEHEVGSRANPRSLF